MAVINLDQFIGMNKMDAIDLADKLGYEWRIFEEDGQKYMHVNNAKSNRANFTVQRDTITAAHKG